MRRAGGVPMYGKLWAKKSVNLNLRLAPEKGFTHVHCFVRPTNWFSKKKIAKSWFTNKSSASLFSFATVFSTRDFICNSPFKIASGFDNSFAKHWFHHFSRFLFCFKRFFSDTSLFLCLSTPAPFAIKGGQLNQCKNKQKMTLQTYFSSHGMKEWDCILSLYYCHSFKEKKILILFSFVRVSFLQKSLPVLIKLSYKTKTQMFY